MQRRRRGSVYPVNLKFNLMKNQLKLASLLLTLAIAAVPALRAADAPADQPEQKRERDPGAMMERVTTELGLTADQEAKWKAIGEQEKTAMKALRDDTSVDKKDKRAKAQEINKGFAEQRQAVLTPDQATKFKEMRAKMRERREQGGERRQKGEKKGDK